MRDLDDTDREILRLLLADARRPYSDIAERVDLSPPAVSDRVDRLRDLGIIERFTLDLDRSKLRAGTPVLVDLTVDPGAVESVVAAIEGTEAVEHVFRTADARVVFTAVVDGADVTDVLGTSVDPGAIREYEVDLLADSAWQPSLGEVELAGECAECGNTVTSEGETATLDGKRYEFCCPSCRSSFVEQYETLRENA
jgi:DNA-binding Lrp family transcriptional regulator